MFKKKISQNFNTNGYHIIKSFLNTNEVNFLIKEIYKDLKVKDKKKTIGGQNQLIQNPHYWKLFTNKKLTDCVKYSLKSDKICFVQHTDIHINFGAGIFHRDNANRKFMSSPDWDETQSRYGIVRVAIYLSSYSDSGNSLILIPNSHKKQSILQIKEIKLFNKIHNFFRKFKIQIPHFLFFSKIKKIKLEKGDLVFFDERLLHAGGRINFKKPKISIFFAYGLKNNHTKNHVNFLIGKNNNNKNDVYKLKMPIKLEKQLKVNNILFK